MITAAARLSCHKQYGEATALLAADALVTAAFEAVANAPTHPQSRVQAAAHLAKAAGARGMLYGQELDKHYETVHASESELLELHAHKTGALIIAGVDLGCDAAQADDALCTALQHYAAELGLVFQIVDDILDVTATTEELGKPVGSDAENDKTTFITLYGLEGARSLAKQHNDAALAAPGGSWPGSRLFARDGSGAADPQQVTYYSRAGGAAHCPAALPGTRLFGPV